MTLKTRLKDFAKGLGKSYYKTVFRVHALADYARRYPAEPSGKDRHNLPYRFGHAIGDLTAPFVVVAPYFIIGEIYDHPEILGIPVLTNFLSLLVGLPGKRLENKVEDNEEIKN